MSLLWKLLSAFSFATTNRAYTIPLSEMKNRVGLIGAGLLVHANYAYGTRREETHTIDNKYQIVSLGQTHYALSTTKGEQLLIPHSLWYWQWAVPEQWQALPVGKEVQLTTYGYRIPWAGVYKQVVAVNPARA